MLLCEDIGSGHVKTFTLDPEYRRRLRDSDFAGLITAGAFRSGYLRSAPDTDASAVSYFSAHFMRGGCPLVLQTHSLELLPAIRRFFFWHFVKGMSYNETENSKEK